MKLTFSAWQAETGIAGWEAGEATPARAGEEGIPRNPAVAPEVSLSL